jgi:hypothetical protein
MVYELNDESGEHHVICFQDPVHAGSKGIDVKSIVGRYLPDAKGQFDPAAFQFNTAFVNQVADFMNSVVSNDQQLVEEAKRVTEGRLEVIDPRCENDQISEIPLSEIVGWFAVDPSGQILPDSFLYNHNHTWFDPSSGTSGLLKLRRFYDFLRSPERDSKTRD